MRVGSCGAIIACSCPSQPSRIGWRRGEKKAGEKWERDYLAWALTDFSGDLAADELYDGPFCVLSIVDNHTFKRLFFQVLDHHPTQEAMIAFFQRFQLALQVRNLTVRGMTTDGSTLYPAAIQAVWGICPIQSANSIF